MGGKQDENEGGAPTSEAGAPPPQTSVQALFERATHSSNYDIARQRLDQALSTLWFPKDESPEDSSPKTLSAIQTLAEIQPRDAVEQMLASQMIACHEAAMECARRAMIPEQTFAGRESSLKHFEKLTATYAKLVDTLNKHRGKGQQKVTVEHVNVAAGGQAIVGSVETGGGSRPGPEKPALENAPELPMQAVGAPRSKVEAARKRKGENARNS